MMSISERDSYLEKNPHIVQEIVSGLPQIDSFRTRTKPSQDHRDRLREIAKAHPKGKVDTW